VQKIKRAANGSLKERSNVETIEEIGRITVSRTLPQDLGQRKIVLYLDGSRVGSLANGDALTHELPPGSHTVKVHNTLYGKSAAFSVAQGEHVRSKPPTSRAPAASWGSCWAGARCTSC
jgi:hypothetical protein